jgi:hypothetical protein
VSRAPLHRCARPVASVPSIASARPGAAALPAGSRFDRIRLAAGIVLLAAAAAGPLALTVSAQPAAPAWSQLTPVQRAALAPLEPGWAGLTPAQRAKWQQVADRLPSMPPAERERVRERMAEWAAMSPEERRRARLQFTDARLPLSAEERQARWQAYLQLDASTREALQPVGPQRPTPKAALAASAIERTGTAGSRTPRPAAGASTGASAAAPLAKHNREIAFASAQALPVAPSVVQARPGATTTLMSRAPAPPPPVQAGLPRINALPGFVDARTLLPLRGAQAAGVMRPATVVEGDLP